MNIHTPSDYIRNRRMHLAAITAAAANGNIIDARGFRNIMFLLQGAPSGAGTTLDAKLQAGNLSDGSDMADVAGATFDQMTTAGGASIQAINVTVATKQYYRVVATGAGANAAGVYAVTAHLVNGNFSPVTQDTTSKTFQV